ncbi:MAG: hypothetical protein ACLQDY_01770 [Streptosporangiaceae bacterium]
MGEELVVEVGFRAAQARLANLTHGDWLHSASEVAYGDGLTGLMRVGPTGGRMGMSKLVRVHFREVVERDDAAVLIVRWEAAGHGSGLFPALDADITMTPAGPDATRLALAGAYRPPLATLGAGLDRTILHRVATATIRSLLGRVASALADPEQAAQAARAPAARLLPWMIEPDAIT